MQHLVSYSLLTIASNCDSRKDESLPSLVGNATVNYMNLITLPLPTRQCKVRIVEAEDFVPTFLFSNYCPTSGIFLSI